MNTDTLFHIFLLCMLAVIFLLWVQSEEKHVAKLQRMKTAADRKRDAETTHFRVADTGTPPPGRVERKAARELHLEHR